MTEQTTAAAAGTPGCGHRETSAALPPVVCFLRNNVGCSSKDSGFLPLYLTSALRRLTQTLLPRAALPADHRLHVSCYGQCGDQAGPGEGACAFIPRTWPRSGLAPPPLACWPGLGDSRQLCLQPPSGPLTQASLSSVCKVSKLLCGQIHLEQGDGSLSGKKSCFLFT